MWFTGTGSAVIDGVAFNVYRKTTTDDVLPLYNPVYGKVITKVPVPGGLNAIRETSPTSDEPSS